MQAPRTTRPTAAPAWAGTHQRGDQGRFGQRVDLDHDARRGTGTGGVGHLVDVGQQPAVQHEGRRSSWCGPRSRVRPASWWNTASASAVRRASAVSMPTSV